MTSNQVTQIDLIRHGEPVGGKRYRGQQDDPLSELGWRQMWSRVSAELSCNRDTSNRDTSEAALLLNESTSPEVDINRVGPTLQNRWDVIITSPLSRCFAFAEKLSIALELELVTDPAIQEIGFGDWEGLTADEIDRTLLMAFYADPLQNTPPNAEPVDQFFKRVTCCWQETLRQFRGKKILWVTHAGVMRALFTHVNRLDLDAMFRISIDYAQMENVLINGASQSGSLISLASRQ